MSEKKESLALKANLVLLVPKEFKEHLVLKVRPDLSQSNYKYLNFKVLPALLDKRDSLVLKALQDKKDREEMMGHLVKEGLLENQDLLVFIN